MEWIADPEAWIALLTLTALEIVLGIDNIIFISILAGKLQGAEEDRARQLGLLMAMLTRIALLLSLAWLIGLTRPLFEVFGRGFSGRDLILIAGGLFLLGKSTVEIHEKLEGEEGRSSAAQGISRRRDRTDHAAGCRLLVRLCTDSSRDGESIGCDDHRYRYRCSHHAGGFRSYQPLCQRPAYA